MSEIARCSKFTLVKWFISTCFFSLKKLEEKASKEITVPFFPTVLEALIVNKPMLAPISINTSPSESILFMKEISGFSYSPKK